MHFLICGICWFRSVSKNRLVLYEKLDGALSYTSGFPDSDIFHSLYLSV